MVFGNEYFKKNKKKIIQNYYNFCENLSYVTPLYRTAKPTVAPIEEQEDSEDKTKKQYFRLILDNKIGERVIWVSAITQDGFLLFIKTKIYIYNNEGEAPVLLTLLTKDRKHEQKIKPVDACLLQQTMYYRNGNDIAALSR